MMIETHEEGVTVPKVSLNLGSAVEQGKRVLNREA
jgi:hypothetical protein